MRSLEACSLYCYCVLWNLLIVHIVTFYRIAAVLFAVLPQFSVETCSLYWYCIVLNIFIIHIVTV
jgi:hypothetical protein